MDRTVKNIEEAAKEFTPFNFDPNHEFGQFYYGVQCEAFKAGANYVLECLEEATNICFDEEILNVIRQLKN